MACELRALVRESEARIIRIPEKKSSSGETFKGGGRVGRREGRKGGRGGWREGGRRNSP